MLPQHHLSLVDDVNDTRIGRDALLARMLRVDELRVNRDTLRTLIPREWSHEALARGEERAAQQRANVTVSERMDAWAGLFKLSKRMRGRV